MIQSVHYHGLRYFLQGHIYFVLLFANPKSKSCRDLQKLDLDLDLALYQRVRIIANYVNNFHFPEMIFQSAQHFVLDRIIFIL